MSRDLPAGKPNPGSHSTAADTNSQTSSYVLSLTGSRFALPTPEAMLMLPPAVGLPASIDTRTRIRALLDVFLLGGLAFFPSGVLWSEVLRAGNMSGWPEAYIRAVLAPHVASGAVIGPVLIDGQEILQHGPNFPDELFTPIIAEALRIQSSDDIVN